MQIDSPEFPPIKAHLQALEGNQVNYEMEWQDRYSQSQITRLVQEGLTNIAKHAQASHVIVLLERKRSDFTNQNSLTLIITDDGKGMPSEIAPHDLGLPGMRERVLAAGFFSINGARDGSGEKSVCSEAQLFINPH